ncbi:restriction endonuclease subunit S [Xanthomonas campestris]|uniref:restriction endonuclease subunit S n=1 Tax=Xanthomonas campestris TaxID=339 RepID=UPI002B224CB4|nr:restriction endonuclease subunit S [Xanthomonas campestris]MEA9490289.1 restriction endonuclease subunit S [Xanthomonas campestris]MEA9508590.1 restriction endonuclease subunit S [Xanthomonas campestris]
MEVKPGYKLTDVGVIPEDWEIKSFGELFEFRNGVNADKNAYGEGVRFINVLEPIAYSHLHGPDIPGRVSLPERIINHYAVKKGDVIFNRTSETESEIGLAATYLDSEVVVFGGFVIRGRPIFQALDPLYSGYAFRAPFIRSQIVPMGQGAVRANIGQQSLGKVLAPIPPYEDQRAIASVLSDMDALLDGLDRLIAKKRAIKQSAMQQLLTGQTRLSGFSGVWEAKRLGDLAWIEMGQSPDSRHYNRTGDGVPLIQGNSDIDFGLTIARVWTTQVAKEGLAGDLLLTVRAPVGAVGKISENCCLGRGVCSIRPRVDTDFLFHALVYSEPAWKSLEQGSTFTSANSKQVSSFTLLVPVDGQEQTAIAAILSDMDIEITALETRRTKIRALKQAMMQELLTGKTRLV